MAQTLQYFNEVLDFFREGPFHEESVPAAPRLLPLAPAKRLTRSPAGTTIICADIVLRGGDLASIIEAIDVARRARRLVFENFAFAALYNLTAIPLAALGLVTPLIAAATMAGSSLFVILNALRLARGARQ